VSTASRGVAKPLDVPAGDNLHLRAVLEAQPITLMRVGSDGSVLAVNDAGLATIGAERHEQVLGTSFTDRLPDDDRASFLAFIKRVATGHRGSLVVDLNAFTGHHSTMQVRATAHPGAPDGIESVLLTLLDITESRRLEQSLVEAMTRKADEEAAYETERERLAVELRGALESQSDADTRLAEIAELKRRVDGLEHDRQRSTERHAAELQALTEALEQGRQVNQEQTAHLQRFADLEERFATLTQRHAQSEVAAQTLAADLENSRIELDAARAESATARAESAAARAVADAARLDADTTRADADTAREGADAARADANAARADADAARAEAADVRIGLEKEIATGRTLLESAHAEVARYLADLAALREELDGAIHTQVEQVARAQREAELNAARLAAIEIALAAAQSARDSAIARAHGLAQAGSRLARQLESEVGAAAVIGISAGELGQQLETAVANADGHLPIAVMVAAPDVRSSVTFEIVQQAIDAIASDRRAVASTGRIVIEVAPVDVDEGASRSRGDMRAGAYLLVAMHVVASDAAGGLAPELFESTDPAVWAHAGSPLFTAFEAMRLARGWLWLAREGASDVVFELYVPRVEDQFTETKING
jgi:PAS domain S-box-containing protein